MVRQNISELTDQGRKLEPYPEEVISDDNVVVNDNVVEDDQD